MADPAAFVLPAGVNLSFEGDSLSIENAGDIVIEGAPAQRLSTLTSTGGDIVLTPPKAVSLKSISAPSGRVTLAGKISVDVIDAQDVDFSRGSLKVSVIKATGTVALSGTKLEATVVIAPEVGISPDLKGRATAIQSDNEIGPHKLKGGFSLSEFVSLMPNGAEILESHDIEVPEDDDEDDDEDDEDDEDDDAAPRAGPADEPAEPEDEEEEDEAGAAKEPDTPDLEVEDEPEVDPEPVEVDPAVRSQVGDALTKIRSSYEDGDLPPPIALLGQMIEAEDFPGLKMQINTIWSDLLKYHQQTGLYISNTVTHMFQTIQLLMRKVEA